MRDWLVLIVHLITTVFRLLSRGGLRAVVAESVLVKHQLLILNRSRQRSPNLRMRDRLIAGLCSLWIKPIPSCRDSVQTVNTAEFSSRSGSTKVSIVIFAKANKT